MLNPLDHLIKIWNLLTKTYDFIKKIFAVGNQLYKVVAGFLLAAGSGIIALVAFSLDVAGKLIDMVSGKGTVGAYAATIMDGKISTHLVDTPINDAAAAALSWITFASGFIPVDHLFEVFCALVLIFWEAIVFRTVKAFIFGVA